MSVVQLDNICMDYGSKTVLNHVNLSVDSGEMLCLMGESGSGKSTILNIIGLLESPTKGHLSLFGHAQRKIRLLVSKLWTN